MLNDIRCLNITFRKNSGKLVDIGIWIYAPNETATKTRGRPKLNNNDSLDQETDVLINDMNTDNTLWIAALNKRCRWLHCFEYLAASSI